MGDADGRLVDERVVVYSGLDANLVDMVETMLEAEGMEPARQGRASAALVGVGMYAIEQHIAVPAEHAEAARALIAELDRPIDPDQEQALERAAAEPAPRSPPPRTNFSGLGMLMLVVVAAFALRWLMR